MENACESLSTKLCACVTTRLGSLSFSIFTRAILGSPDLPCRIYRTARQRFGRDNRSDAASSEPQLEATHITDEVYSGWMEEVRIEEERILKEEREKMEVAKVIRAQEAETRRRLSANKNFVLSKVSSLQEDSRLFGKIMQEEVQSCFYSCAF